jgi:hypothetical protein
MKIKIKTHVVAVEMVLARACVTERRVRKDAQDVKKALNVRAGIGGIPSHLHVGERGPLVQGDFGDPRN